MDKWIDYLNSPDFKNKPSILKNNLQEDANGNISWDSCTPSSSSGTSGGRKKTKKRINKHLKKTRRRKHKKRKRRTMYKKKIYTRKH